jgi:precorrin-2 dehydrogenase/sirohydrochlorin ferrochelatase
MAYYPVLMQMEGLPVLVVGGGRVAERKVRTLLEHGAVVHVVSRDLTDGLRSLAAEGVIRVLGSVFEESQLSDMRMVIAATDDAELNRTVSRCARDCRLPVNAVDQPEDCSFIVPSIVRRGDLVIAVSTSGKSPALAQRIRRELEARFGEEYAIVLSVMGRLRQAVLDLGLSQEENRRIFHGAVDSGLVDAVRQNDAEGACEALRPVIPKGVSARDLVAGLL